MQNTRITTIVNGTLTRFTRFSTNPWRQTSLIIISFLLGNFFGTMIVTIAGQTAALDVVAAFMLMVFTEIVSWFSYRIQRPKNNFLGIEGGTFFLDLLNALKIGIVYSLFVEAFKLGS
jgi:hypothetical protein